MKKRLPVLTCADCDFRGRGRIESSVELWPGVPHGPAQAKAVSGVVVSVQGDRRKLFCVQCGGANTRLAKRAANPPPVVLVDAATLAVHDRLGVVKDSWYAVKNKLGPMEVIEVLAPVGAYKQARVKITGRRGGFQTRLAKGGGG